MADAQVLDKNDKSGFHRGRWRVLKFGGTSVASAPRWRSIEAILRQRHDSGISVVLVLSALSGVTDALTQLLRAVRAGADPADGLARLRELHTRLGAELGIDADGLLGAELEALRARLGTPPFDAAWEARVLASGELLSTRLGHAYLEARGVASAWMDARSILIADPVEGDRPEAYLSASCTCVPSDEARARVATTGAKVVVTQGFIARKSDRDATVVLGRGGSDTSAAYLACAIGAERLEIWTDVPGVMTANPKVVPGARLLSRVSYREAQACGALGAKVIHPRAIDAVFDVGIPVEIGWTEHPDVLGTRINAARSERRVKAIPSRRNLALVICKRPPSWQPVGFLAEVAQCFERRGLSMDLVSSSCSEIRVTVDLSAFPSAAAELDVLADELSKGSEVRIVRNAASVSLVGAGVGRELMGQHQVLGLFAEEALYMVVYAANEQHVSFVLDEMVVDEVVRTAHEQLFSDEETDLGPTWTEMLAEKNAGKEVPAA